MDTYYVIEESVGDGEYYITWEGVFTTVEAAKQQIKSRAANTRDCRVVEYSQGQRGNPVIEDQIIPKKHRSNETAVLISRGYGGGWFTWNLDTPEMLFDPDIAEMVLDEKSTDEIAEVARAKWPIAYLGGADGLMVVWMPQGTHFRVTEYDGYESIELKNQLEWQVA
jgi:hypothetical protein